MASRHILIGLIREKKSHRPPYFSMRFCLIFQEIQFPESQKSPGLWTDVIFRELLLYNICLTRRRCLTFVYATLVQWCKDVLYLLMLHLFNYVKVCCLCLCWICLVMKRCDAVFHLADLKHLIGLTKRGMANSQSVVRQANHLGNQVILWGQFTFKLLSTERILATTELSFCSHKWKR